MNKLAVFDMNETTLDLAPVRAVVNEVLGTEHGFDHWFGRMLQTSMAVTAAGIYLSFGELARASLGSVATTLELTLPDDAFAPIGEAMGAVRAHPDVVEALDRLVAGGWRLISLTNSAQAAVDQQLASAGIADRFEHVLSVESVQAFKPAAAPYRLAADTAGVSLDDMLMVASHDWDLAGAKAVGMQTAFVARPRMPFSTAYPTADITVADFGQLADRLLS